MNEIVDRDGNSLTDTFLSPELSVEEILRQYRENDRLFNLGQVPWEEWDRKGSDLILLLSGRLTEEEWKTLFT